MPLRRKHMYVLHMCVRMYSIVLHMLYIFYVCVHMNVLHCMYVLYSMFIYVCIKLYVWYILVV